MTLAPSLLATLVTGIDASATQRVARMLDGHPDGSVSTALFDEPSEPHPDSATLALALAEQLERLADDGLAGRLTIAIDPLAEVLETALVLEAALDTEHSDKRIALADVIAVIAVDEVHAYLFGDPEPPEPLAFLWSERVAAGIESASVVVITGLGRNEDRDAAAVALVRALNPTAHLSSPTSVARRHRHPQPGLAARLARSAGWMTALGGDRLPPIAETHVQRTVFRDPRPFHPERLAAVLAEELVPDRVGTLVRSRGFARLASRPRRVASWAGAGAVLALDPTSMDGADPDEPFGAELVFFGRDFDAERLHGALASALLDGAELALPAELWAGFPDPFPAWERVAPEPG